MPVIINKKRKGNRVNENIIKSPLDYPYNVLSQDYYIKYCERFRTRRSSHILFEKREKENIADTSGTYGL